MIENKWGRIINIASIGGQWGGFNQVHYAAAKAGLINLTQSIAKIYSKDGITSNAISPGLVATDMSKDELNTQACVFNSSFDISVATNPGEIALEVIPSLLYIFAIL